MAKMTVVVTAMALLAFGLGVWTKSSVFATAATTPAVSTISPAELHLRVKPEELPVLVVDNYN